MALDVFLLGESKFWLLVILFHFWMTNYPLNISIWKFTFIIFFYPTHLALIIFLPLPHFSNHSPWKSWRNIWLIFLHSPLFKRSISSVDSLFSLSSLSSCLSLDKTFQVLTNSFINLTSPSPLLLVHLKLFQLMTQGPFSPSACLTSTVSVSWFPVTVSHPGHASFRNRAYLVSKAQAFQFLPLPLPTNTLHSVIF